MSGAVIRPGKNGLICQAELKDKAARSSLIYANIKDVKEEK